MAVATYHLSPCVCVSVNDITHDVIMLSSNNHRAFGSPFNQPDENKVQLSPRPSTMSHSSSMAHHRHHHHHQPPSITNPPSTPHTSSAAGRGDTPATSAAKVPLTRRKWLESSVPGLIFGGGGEEASVDSTSRKEQSISDDHEGTSSQSGVTSSRCKLTL